jgi:hypothetical protein
MVTAAIGGGVPFLAVDEVCGRSSKLHAVREKNPKGYVLTSSATPGPAGGENTRHEPATTTQARLRAASA